ncbi:hypothetical protein [Ideonella sp. YS5]|uniref:hypothetical protein n=1 Tax=Ideonella sp. YS5 TaxID=3453714 RepID=UPI003F6FE851
MGSTWRARLNGRRRRHRPGSRYQSCSWASDGVLGGAIKRAYGGANKSLRELERLGAIALDYGAIEIRDVGLLRQACGQAASVANARVAPGG